MNSYKSLRILTAACLMSFALTDHAFPQASPVTSTQNASQVSPQSNPIDETTAQLFVPYGLQEKAMLATSYLVNPRRADQAVIGEFIPFDKMDSNNFESIGTLVQNGEARYSLWHENGIYAFDEQDVRNVVKHTESVSEIKQLAMKAGLSTEKTVVVVDAGAVVALKGLQGTPVISWADYATPQKGTPWLEEWLQGTTTQTEGEK